MINWLELTAELLQERDKRIETVCALARTGDTRHSAGVLDGINIALSLVKKLEDKERNQ